MATEPMKNGLVGILQEMQKHPDKVVIVIDHPNGIIFGTGEGIDLTRAVYLLDQAKYKVQQTIDA